MTGGAGFIGAALVQRLAAEGHRVAVVDDCSRGNRQRLQAVPLAGFLQADVSHGDLGPFFASMGPVVVVHLAALRDVESSLRAPSRVTVVNVCGTVNVLQCSLACGVRRFILASTGGALYGDLAPRPTPEDCPLHPLSPYGASKVAAEAYVAAMGGTGGMGYGILRLGNVYGPHQTPSGPADVVTTFARAMVRGERPVIHGDGLSVRDYVHVSDVVEAHVRALDMDGNQVLNIGTGAARTVLDVFAAVAQAVGYDGTPIHTRERPGEIRRSCLDVRRAQKILGWRATVPFEAGIHQVLASLQPPHRDDDAMPNGAEAISATAKVPGRRQASGTSSMVSPHPRGDA